MDSKMLQTVAVLLLLTVVAFIAGFMVSSAIKNQAYDAEVAGNLGDRTNTRFQ